MSTMSTRGVAPLDPATAVGALRLIVGDDSFVPLDPPEAGYGAFAVWSDDALAATLAAQGDNQLRAAGHLYRQLAIEYIQVGRSVRTDDLTLDTRNRGTDFLKIAQSFFDQADDQDAAAVDEFFQIVPLAEDPACDLRPEATPWPWPSL